MTLIKTLVKHFDLEYVQLRNGELSKVKEKNVNRSIFFRELTCYLTKHLVAVCIRAWVLVLHRSTLYICGSLFSHFKIL